MRFFSPVCGSRDLGNPGTLCGSNFPLVEEDFFLLKSLPPIYTPPTQRDTQNEPVRIVLQKHRSCAKWHRLLGHRPQSYTKTSSHCYSPWLQDFTNSCFLCPKSEVYSGNIHRETRRDFDAISSTGCNSSVPCGFGTSFSFFWCVGRGGLMGSLIFYMIRSISKLLWDSCLRQNIWLRMSRETTCDWSNLEILCIDVSNWNELPWDGIIPFAGRLDSDR